MAFVAIFLAEVVRVVIEAAKIFPGQHLKLYFILCSLGGSWWGDNLINNSNKKNEKPRDVFNKK
jgi:hypothetical protein